MIIKNILDYCTDFERIENYKKAIADTDNIWECHHRLEIMPFSNKTVSIDYLKKQGLYYKQSPNAFIFLTKQEHRKLHFTGNNFAKGKNLGKEYDRLKTEYCKSHKIPLIRIPYTKYKTLCLDDLLLEKSKFVI